MPERLIMRLDVLTIYLKEMKEVLRDRKSLIFMLVMPTLFVPLLMNILVGFIIKTEKKAETEVLTYTLFGAEYFPELANELKNETGFKKVDIDSPDELEQAIKQNRIRFGLVLPESARSQIEAAQQVTIELYYDNASATSKVKNRVNQVVQRVAKNIRSHRLEGLGLNTAQQQQSLIEPVVIKDHGTADLRETLGERIGGMLPYLFIIFSLMGAMWPAIDIGAGEKERGTLETLLLVPVQRYKIVLGKFLVIFTTAVTAALLSLTSIGVMLAVKVKDIPEAMELRRVILSIGPADLVLVAAMLIPTAAIFAALLLSISIYARSYKEASSYCGFLNFLVIIPAVISMLPIGKLNWYWAMVPITNISLATKEIIKGTISYQMLIVIFLSTVIIAGAMLFFCTKWFERESVIFRR
jgi:sodium transport system permease protein